MEYGSVPASPEGTPKRRDSAARRMALRAAPLLAAGAVGAGIAVGIGAAVADGETVTVVQQAATATAGATEAATGTTREPAAFETDEALTVAELYRRSAPGVVRVTSLAQVGDPVAPEGEQPIGTGSGFVVDKEGHIVTNYHVVESAEHVEVTFSDQEPVEARVVGVDPSTDLAVLDVDLPATALTPLPLGEASEVQVGDEVVAIGNPFGLDRTVTKGIVSALQRRIQAPNGFAIEGAVQTDAAINRGNSGGPLLNAAGEVIGVNAQIETGGFAQGNVGVGFAIPIDTVREVTAQLIETGEVQRAYLGVEMQTITEELAQNFSLPVDEGVLIARVVPGTPADQAGLRGGTEQVIVNGEGYTLGGDIVTAADGEAVTTLEELREIVLSHDPGDTVRLEVNRDGEQMTIQVELGRQPTTPTG